jgi:hypothetical protein
MTRCLDATQIYDAGSSANWASDSVRGVLGALSQPQRDRRSSPRLSRAWACPAEGSAPPTRSDPRLSLRSAVPRRDRLNTLSQAVIGSEHGDGSLWVGSPLAPSRVDDRRLTRSPRDGLKGAAHQPTDRELTNEVDGPALEEARTTRLSNRSLRFSGELQKRLGGAAAHRCS